MIRLTAAVVAGVLLAACDKSSEERGEPAPAPPAGSHVVVYVADDTPAAFDQRTARFTGETGIRVSVRRKPGPQIAEDVMADRGTPPADIMISPDVAGAWRAADDGALLPLDDDTIAAVPVHLRDPDNYWAAVDVRMIAIVYDPARIDAAALGGYQDLGGARFAGKLCLSSASNATNRALIAMLIDALGVRPAEVVVRGWTANLALPPLPGGDDVLAAIRAEQCAVGIVAIEAGAAPPAGDIAVYVPAPAYGDVHAIGIARHAHAPDAARRFVAWYLDGIHATLDVPALAGRNVGVAGALDEDAALLAERAGYR